MIKLDVDQLSRGVAIFILNELGEILLLLRSAGSQIGFWEIPSGHVKNGEGEIDTVVREVKEEAGLDIVDLIEIGINEDRSLGFMTTIYKTKNFSGIAENLEKDQHSDMKWFSFNKLPENIGSTTKKGLELLSK